MSDTLVLNMPVELCLELMAPVCADGVDPEGELLDKVINEVTRIRLVMSGVDFEGAYPGRIVDRGVLIPLDCFFVFIQKLQKLNINLDVMTRHLFLIPFGVDFTPAHITR